MVRISAPVRAAAQRLALPGFVFVSAMLAVMGKADVLVVDRARVMVADAVAPLLEAVAQPIASAASVVDRAEDMVNVYRDNIALRQENHRLLQWQQAAQRLAAENTELRALVKLVPEHARSSITGRVIADSGGAFLRNVLIDAGARNGVQRGQAALTGDGLVGRVAEVGERTARILLLTDLNSHIPVMLETTSERAVLDGDNSDLPLLAYLDPKTKVHVGDRVVTSGSGGVFPPGLPVGVIAAIQGKVVRVEPYAELSRLDFVRVVDYGLSGLLPESVVPPPRSSRGAKARPVEAER